MLLWQCPRAASCLRSDAHTVHNTSPAPLFFFPFFFSPWEVVSSVCSFFFFNTPPTCDHHLQLGLCWAITMHKSQGQTLDKAVIDLGPKEACTTAYFRLPQKGQETCRPDRRAHEYNSALMYLVPRYVYVGTYVPGLVHIPPPKRTEGLLKTTT